jgi:dGTPase
MKKDNSFYDESAEGDWRREASEPSGKDVGEPFRSPARRDLARLIHCPAFRRLQRKTQLFPNDKSDFFRTRLTHSMEVAQIAKSITLKLNDQIRRERRSKPASYVGARQSQRSVIDTDLVEFAALAHDIGHPPFGHVGEMALDECMKGSGGFEGNAQSLRILARLQKKRVIGQNYHAKGVNYEEFHDGNDLRAGLNLTARSLASILKYDKAIPIKRDAIDPVAKGYYKSEEDLVNKIKTSVMIGYDKKLISGGLKTIEMQIMDLADDIAYSTYDLEDAMEAGFASPLNMLSEVGTNFKLREVIGKKMFKFRKGFDYNEKDDAHKKTHEAVMSEINKVIRNLFGQFFEISSQPDNIREMYSNLVINRKSKRRDREIDFPIFSQAFVMNVSKMSDYVRSNGYHRTEFTSNVVRRRMQAVEIVFNDACPPLSIVKMKEDKDGNDHYFEIELLKTLAYELQIHSPKMQVIESRGKEITSALFKSFSDDTSGALLPADWRSRLFAIQGNANKTEERSRLVCDYISGMTDAYALETYSRLSGSSSADVFHKY